MSFHLQVYHGMAQDWAMGNHGICFMPHQLLLQKKRPHGGLQVLTVEQKVKCEVPSGVLLPAQERCEAAGAGPGEATKILRGLSQREGLGELTSISLEKALGRHHCSLPVFEGTNFLHNLIMTGQRAIA